jgi:hypothetical protein
MAPHRLPLIVLLCAGLIALACAGATQRRPRAASAAPSRLGVRQATPIVPPVTSGGEPLITPDLDGQVVQVAAGQIFLVQLGEEYRWQLHFDPSDAARSWLPVYMPRGAQGYYSIDQPGATVVLTASGATPCPAGADPSCTPAAGAQLQITLVTSP